METVRVCPKCGAPLAPDAPQGLCPQCLLQQGLASPSEWNLSGGAARPSSSRFVPPDPADLGRHFPQLEILELLGQGGMGAVYKARQRGLDRLVALKILPPETGGDTAFSERFTREARALARLNHPHIVAVYDFGRAGGLYYFLMEYIDGVNLRQMLQAQKLPPRQALVIVPQICDALQYAHDEGIVHRDIKPENILLNTKGRVKIADFGLAKLLGQAPGDYRLTGAQQVMGTPHYMAPEQLETPQAVDHRADIYSLGVVFYEMLTGQLPLGHFAPPSSKVQVDVRLDEVVLRTLAREPERRYQNVSDLKSQVENISGIVANLPPHMRKMFGFEYRSKRMLWGLPLVHIATGTDPITGKRRVAKGIIAFGDVAKGVLAFGGIAIGGIACGGLAIGVVPIGGAALGLISIGGATIGLLLAYGGLAIAPIALGGLAIGYYAQGGGAYGVHAFGGNVRDPVAKDFFEPWVGPWMMYLVLALVLIPPLVPVLVPWMMQRRAIRKEQKASGQGSLP